MYMNPYTDKSTAMTILCSLTTID